MAKWNQDRERTVELSLSQSRESSPKPLDRRVSFWAGCGVCPCAAARRTTKKLHEVLRNGCHRDPFTSSPRQAGTLGLELIFEIATLA